MPAATPPGAPAFRDLDRPRPPSSAEQRLLSWLAGVDRELTAQAAAAVVVGACTCGCSSVRLSTSAAPLPPAALGRLSAAALGRLSAGGRPGHVAVGSTGRSPEGHVVSVVLHVVRGRLYELEVFGTVAGEGAAVDPAGVTALVRPAVG